MTIRVVDPVTIRLEGYEKASDELKRQLTFFDKKVDFELQKVKKSHWLASKLGPQGFKEHLDNLKAQRQKSLLFQDETGLWTYSGLAKRIANIFDDRIIDEVSYPETALVPWANKPSKEPRPYQVKARDALLEIKHGGVEMGCHRRGEKVMCFNGALKAVEDIAVGDLLMGPDSLPREVLSLKHGIDSMYCVETRDGQKMYVNGNHLLALKHIEAGNTLIITVEGYLAQDEDFKHNYLLFSAPVDFEHQKTIVSPYSMGSLAAADKSKSRRIPEAFKLNDRKARLELLAGAIDQTGYLVGACYDVRLHSEAMAGDIAFIARTLGFRAMVSHQPRSVLGKWSVIIHGDLADIPVQSKFLIAPRRISSSTNLFTFTVTKVSDSEEHFGFTLDRDHLYLTDTCLVTHNTGLGKSFILQLLFKSIGLKTVIMAPSVSIAEQLYKEIEHHFGKKYVGFFGGGKKESKKLITIAIAASLAKVEESSDAWNELSQAEVFIADESHLTPAVTLQRTCFGLLRNAPYRFFFSGTQMRNDGLDLVLEGITGPIVYNMTVQEGVDQGYLAKPIFTMMSVESDSRYMSDDANAMTRTHLYYNPRVNALAADIANKSVSLLKRPTLILVEEIEQFTHLLPYLRHQAAFAHGGVNKENKDKLPAEFHQSDPNALVAAFNEGKLPILVGTSCVSTGTDIKAASHIIYLMGGKSEIQVKQAVGRGTRLFEGKTDCYVTDFDVSNIKTTHRHAAERAAIYENIYPSVRYVR